MENKQLQQAKDTIAKKYGYENFEQFDDKSTFGYNHDTPKIIDEVAIEYHRLMSEWKKQSIEIIQSNERVFKVSQIRGLFNQVLGEKISFSRFVEILNENANRKTYDINPLPQPPKK